MNEPCILVFGGNGWIGSRVCKLLSERKINYHLASSRADDYENVEREIQNSPNLTHIMSFIGRTHGVYEGEKIKTIDYLEKPGKLKENICDNLFAPLCLAQLANKYNLHYTYLGTGCIFDFDEEHPYGNEETGFKENDKPNFFGSSYSIVKGYTDRLMHILNNDNTLNVRIRMPITEEFNERNFITKITQYDKICSNPNSMTVLPDLLPYLIDMSISKKTGTINLTNPGLINHNEILEMYKEIVDPSFTWKTFTTEEQDKILSAKRSNNYLDATELSTMYPVLNIKDAVRNVLYKMAELNPKD